MILRAAILTLGLVPYVYFGVLDLLQHRHVRPTPWPERLLHLSLGLTLATVISHAFFGRREIVLIGLTLFVAVRAIDEFAFHRGLPAAESSLHAKTHLGFIIFVIAILSADWIAPLTANASNE